MLQVCVRVYSLGNQAAMRVCACKQCHQLLWVEHPWSSGSVRGEGTDPGTMEGVSCRWGREAEGEEEAARLEGGVKER